MVELPWDDKSWADVFGSPAPPFERLHRLVHLVHAHIEEWVGHEGVQPEVGEEGTPSHLTREGQGPGGQGEQGEQGDRGTGGQGDGDRPAPFAGTGTHLCV